MIRSKTKTSAKGAAFLERLEKIAKSTDGAYVTVGVHDDAGQYEGKQELQHVATRHARKVFKMVNVAPTVAQVAAWNEFGTGKIPERSFLRSTLTEQTGNLARWRIEALRNIATNGWPVTKALEMIGLRLQVKIQNKIKSNVPPPNAPSTVERKKEKGIAPRTLIETTLLLRSIRYKVFVPEGMPPPGPPAIEE